MRRIHEIKDLPISQLSDEEICKAAMYRLNARVCILIYDDQTSVQTFVRWNSARDKFIWRELKKAYDNYLGKIKTHKQS